MSDLHDDGVSHRDADLAEQMIRATGAQCTDRVTIAGREHVDLLIGLCRRGFAEVSCRAYDQGPRSGDGPADILCVPKAADDTQLSAILTRLGSDLRPQGVLVLRHARRLSRSGMAHLREVLAGCGFTLEHSAGTTRDGSFLCARKAAPAQLRRAA